MSVNLTVDSNSTVNTEFFNKNDVLAIGITNKLLLSILIVFTIWYLQFWYGRKELYKYFSKIPKHTFHLPFIGVGYRFSTNTEKTLNTFLDICKHQTPVGVWLAYTPIVMIHKPEDIQIVLNSPNSMSKSPLYRFINVILGNGLLTAPVSIWKNHRKIILPTFKQKILNNFFSVFTQQSQILIEKLKQDTGKTIDMTERLNNWSLDSICETAMGVKVDSQNIESIFVQSLHRLIESVFARIVNVLFHNDFLYSIFSKAAKQAKADNDYIQNFIKKVLKQKYTTIEERHQDSIERPEAEITDDKKMKPFLDLFMGLTADDGKFSDEELREEAATIILTGSETSATVLGFTTLLLGMYPEVQRKVYEEIMDVVGNQREMVLSDLSELKYMERVMKESMRIFPTGPFSFRQVDEDLHINNYMIPKGCSVGIAAIVLHRSPEYWPDPFKFDPDRFLPEEVAKRHPYTYIPFSAGPRNCIGMNYAMMSMKTVLAYIVRNYHLETHFKNISEIRIKQDIVLRPVEGFPIKLTQRKFD